MDDSWRRCRGLAERIRWARLHRSPFERMIDAAASIPIRYGTYRTYEHDKEHGGREPPLPVIQQIAGKYKVAWQWLATGEGNPDDRVETELQVITSQLAERITQIPDDKKQDALRAVEGVLDAYARRAS